MARIFREEKLVIASHNPGKISEIKDLMNPFSVEILSARALQLPEPEETGQTFRENAVLKARASAKASGFPSLADDSGLCVTALGGEPGIHSARWAGEEKDFIQAMQKIEARLGNNPERRGAFVCGLALVWPDQHVEYFEGRVEGHLVFPPRGTKGFGYDPIFIPSGYTSTFAEIEPAEKHKISHRAHAFRQMVTLCFFHKTLSR